MIFSYGELATANGVPITLVISGGLFVLALILYLILRPFNPLTYFPRDITALRDSSSENFFSKIFYCGPWIRRLVISSEAEIAGKGGLYALLYIRMMKHLIIFSAATSMICLGTLIPINILSGKEWFSGAPYIENADEEPIYRLWAFVAFTWIFSAFSIGLVMLFHRQYISIKHQWRNRGGPETFTIRIKNASKQAINTNEFIQYFNAVFPSQIDNLKGKHLSEVLACQIAFDMPKLTSLLPELQRCRKRSYKAARLLEKNIHSVKQTDSNFDEWLQREREIEKQMEIAKKEEAENPRSTGVVFITFRSRSTVIAAISRYQEHTLPMNEALNVNRWKLKQAPHPNDIIWENLNFSRDSQNFRSILCNIIVVCISLVVAICVAGLVHASTIVTMSPLVTDIVSGYLPALFSACCLALLPRILYRIARFEKPHTKSFWMSSLMRKYYIYVVFNMFIFQILLLGGINLMVQLLKDPTIWDEWLKALNYELIGAFFLNYLMQLALLGGVLDLLRLPDLIERIYRKYFTSAGSLDDEIDISKRAITEERYYVNFSESLLVFLLMLVFCVLVPVILPAACLYFCLKFYIAKNNILFVSPRDFGDGRMIRDVLINMTAGIVLYQILMIGFFFLRASWTQFFIIVPLPFLTSVFFGFLLWNFQIAKNDNLRADILSVERKSTFNKFQDEETDLSATTEQISTITKTNNTNNNTNNTNNNNNTNSDNHQISQNSVVMRSLFYETDVGRRTLETAYMHPALSPLPDVHALELELDVDDFNTPITFNQSMSSFPTDSVFLEDPDVIIFDQSENFNEQSSAVRMQTFSTSITHNNPNNYDSNNNELILELADDEMEILSHNSKRWQTNNN
eukprot:TRINITY_DN813_c0_g1_i1.p1 TRINITY_DN813_c0_g1~~TRINITY_DN813_c0_g1_i1.p1  ORF type:complete len:858 (+),score=334.23 TRINITY_DN813_c0_g1_i1:105-2678(+)